jgi:hypothetical protein
LALKRVRWTWVFAFGLVASACKQGDGESCQFASDCSSGLICCKAQTAERGNCGATCSSTTLMPPKTDEDAGTGTDTGGSMSSEPRDGG